MSRVEILQKMQLVIQEQMGKEDIVLTEATKLDDLGVDSIELMEFIINLEDEFDLEISDDTIDHMVKVADLLDYLSEELNKDKMRIIKDVEKEENYEDCFCRKSQQWKDDHVQCTYRQE